MHPQARKTFQRGPLHLGRFSLVVGWLATFWVAFITVIFVLPTVYPVTKDTLNYASVRRRQLQHCCGRCVLGS